MIEALDDLPERAGGLVDVELIRSWRDSLDDSEKHARRDLWLQWLKVFGRLHETCLARIPNSPGLCEMLSEQHRMHPVIAELISRAYYDKKIRSATIDAAGIPLPKVLHPFSAPTEIKGRAIVWLDVPAVDQGGKAEESHRGLYTSRTEVEAVTRFIRALRVPDSVDEQFKMAVLSPYRLQVYELNSALKSLYAGNLPKWLKPPENRFAANTVDSFQGDQAKIVIVSLVRNNERQPGEGLGFLGEDTRMNVLFSRAEQLLVLVGSWDFFQAQLRGIGSENPALGHWRVALDYLSDCFLDGSAVLLSATAL